MAEWSKALDLGSSLSWRGFESRRVQLCFLQPLRSTLLFSFISSVGWANNECSRPGSSWDMMLWSWPPEFDPHEGVSLFGNFKTLPPVVFDLPAPITNKIEQVLLLRNKLSFLLSHIESHLYKFHIFVSSWVPLRGGFLYLLLLINFYWSHLIDSIKYEQKWSISLLRLFFIERSR